MDSIELIETEVEAVEPAIVKELAKDEDRTRATDNIVSLFRAYRDNSTRQKVQTIWRACYRAYHGYAPTGGPYKNPYVIREILRQMETLKPQVIQQFFGGDTLFNLLPEQDGAEDRVAAASSIIHKQIRRGKMQQNALVPWIENSLFYGTSYLTYGWRKFKRNKLKISRVYAEHSEPMWERKTDEIVVNEPYLDSLLPQEVYCHPSVEDPRNSPAVFIHKAVSPAELKTLVREGYLDAKAVEDALENLSATEAADLMAEQSPTGEYEDILDRTAMGDMPQAMLVCWTSDGWEFVVLNSKHMLRAQRLPNGEIPMLCIRNYPQSGEHYGIPEPLVILEDQRFLNDFTTMFVEGCHYTLNPMWKMKRNTMKDWRYQSFKPGAAIPCEDPMSDILPLESKPVAMDLAQVGDYILGRMKLATGLTDELAGAGSRSKTATGLVRLQDAAGARMSHKVRLIAPILADAYAALYRLNALYLDEEVAVRIDGENGRQAFARYGPESFDADVDVDVQLSNVAETSREMASKWIQIYTSTGQDPLVNRAKILEELFRSLGKKKPKAFFASSDNDQADALGENVQLGGSGVLPAPQPSENHEVHMQVHNLFMRSIDFMTLPPEWQAELQRHMATHQQFLQRMLQQQAQATQAENPDNQGPGSVLPEADQRTEAMFNNAMTGAAQQGAMPGAM